MKWLSLLAILFLGVFSLAGFANRSAAPEDPSQYRFVDISEVATKYDKAKKDLESLQKAFMPQIGDLQRRVEELGKKKRELAPLDRNSQEYYQKSVELEIEELKLKRDQDYLLADRDKKKLQLLLSVYDDIQQTVKKFAEANQLKAVFVVQRDLKVDNEDDLKEKYRMLSFRQVIYREPSLDVTDQIVKILNTH